MRSTVADLRLEVDGRIAWITFDRPDSKVNLLAVEVIRELGHRLDELAERVRADEVGALIVRSAKPKVFIAGADLDELASVETPAQATEIALEGHHVLNRFARLGVPSLAAINGTCLGGGLELALACTYRIAADDREIQIGLPEVRLGLLPGLGGTARLPRLIGLGRALDLILSGRSISPRDALRMGIVHAVVPAENFSTWITRYGQALAVGERPLGRPRRAPLPLRLLDGNPLGRRIVERQARRRVLKETRGHYPAPLRALSVAVEGLRLPLEKAQAMEAEVVGGLLATEICKNLIAVFRLTERARKRRPPGKARPVERAAVVGAGVMGSGIAELFAYRAIPVRLKDVDWDRVTAGLRSARRLLERAGRRLPAHELERRIESLLGTLDYEGFETADLVVEAVVERMEVKKQVFREMEQRVRPHAVLATNTSALSVSELQEGLRHPERVCGMHFFNPAHRMPLLEIVVGRRTDDATLATAFAAGLLLGKTPILVEDRPGFLVNRVLGAYLTEAGHLLQQGVAPEEIDRRMEAFGMPMGPLRLLDEIGLDVAGEVLVTLRNGLGERYTPAPVVALVMGGGRLGRKTGAGFYRYRDERAAGLHPKTASLLREARPAATPPEGEELEDRMVLAMVNEAARALADRVVASPEDVDVGMLLGTGFPPFRGGLLRYADHLGVATVVERLHRLAQAVGDRFRPAPLLEEMARERRRFFDGSGEGAA